MSNPHFARAVASAPQLINTEAANEHYLAAEGVTDQTMQFSALNRIAEATLALVHEQRTANLIAMLETIYTPERVAEIESRLGLGDTK